MTRLLSFALLFTTPLLLPAESLITWKRVQLADKFYAEGANAADINKDGRPDVVSTSAEGMDDAARAAAAGKRRTFVSACRDCMR